MIVKTTTTKRTNLTKRRYTEKSEISRKLGSITERLVCFFSEEGNTTKETNQRKKKVSTESGL